MKNKSRIMSFVGAGIFSAALSTLNGAEPAVEKQPPRPAVTVMNSPRVFAPRFGFKYEDPNNKELAELRSKYKLDELVASAGNDWEITLALIKWANEKVSSANREHPKGKHCTEPLDAVSCLKQLEDGGTGACGIFNRVFQGALASFGIFARDLNCGPSWHAVTDVWSDHWGKWIFMDCMTCSYFESAGVPLSAHEIMKLKIAGARPKMVLVDGGRMIREQKWEKWADEYLEKQFQCVDTVMAADHMSPEWKESSIVNGVSQGGARIYCIPFDIARFIGKEKKVEGINDIYVTDPEHAFNNVFINRCHYLVTDDETDVYWPLNTVEVRLPLDGRFVASEDAPVELVTHAPYLEKMLFRVDGGEWQEAAVGPEKGGLRSAQLTWKLHKGTNILECKVQSAKGRIGRISTVRVEW